jgi:hypothetical protein
MVDHPNELQTRGSFVRSLSVTKLTRLEQRTQLAETWLSEQENSKYRYDVEVCKTGKKVYLLRPTWLNKGFDFQINLEGFKSKSNEAPKHSDVIEDLVKKKEESARDFQKLRKLIGRVYACEEPDVVLASEPNLKFRSGLPVDAVLKILKWMFIEQDLTYWNNSGRRMLMGGISKTLD